MTVIQFSEVVWQDAVGIYREDTSRHVELCSIAWNYFSVRTYSVVA